MWNLTTGLRNWAIRSVPKTGYLLTFASIKTEINANRPIAAGWYRRDPDTGAPLAAGHMVAIEGYLEDTTAGQQSVLYVDPSDGGHYQALYSWFKVSDYHEWRDSVYSIQP